MALKTWQGANGGSWATTGNWVGGTPTLNDDVQFTGSNGANIAATANCKSLTITGSNVTITGASALNIYGNITVNSTTSISATGTWSILNTAGQTTYDITSAGRTFNCSLVLNAGTTSTYRLIKAASSANGNFTMAAARTLTLTSGTLNLNGFNLSVGLFSSSNSNTRGITFSSDHSNYIALTGVGTVFSQTTSAGWSYTGYSDFTVSDASVSAKTVTTTGMSTYPANFYFTGAGTVTLTSGNYFLNLDASSFSGTLSKSSASVMTIGASVLLGPSMTSSIGGTGATTFSLISGLGGSLATGQVGMYNRNWGPMTFSSGAWETSYNQDVGTSAAANDIICSGGSFYINYLSNIYCRSFTVNGGNVTLEYYMVCTQTSTSTIAFAVTSGIFTMTGDGGVTCNVVSIGGGRIAIDAFGYAIDCLRMNFTGGTCYWQGLNSFNSIRYDGYSLGDVHIKHRSVASNWSSLANNLRYDSASVNIVVMFTTYNTASSTLRNITDTSGMFAFCWDFYMTNIQRFGISSGSTIGGLDINYIDPSTFEGGYSFTCNGTYSDNYPTFRTQGGTITFTGGTSILPNYFFPVGGDYPWGVTFVSNSYFRLSGSCSGIRTDASFAFIMSGCTIESMVTSGTSRMYFNVINLNQAGTNIFICSSTDVTQFYATGTSGTVIAARGTGLTFQGVASPSLALYGDSASIRYVYLPSESNYSFSLTTYRACSFTDFYLSSGEVKINDSVFDPVYLYSITLTGQYVVCSVDMIVQSYATITTTQSSAFSRSLTILGIGGIYNPTSTFTKGVNNFISGGIFIGNSTINNTAVTLLFNNDYQGATVTINSGQVTFPPSNIRYILPNLVVNSINASSATTLALLNGITYDEFGSSTIYRPYIRNLTLAATGTINFTSGTILESDNSALTRTWELGGRTIEPTVIVSSNSRLNITDTANLGTTYIKNIISSTSLGAESTPTIVYSSATGGGVFTHSYSASTQTLTFSLYGNSIDDISMNLVYNITVPSGSNIGYTINYSISSEGGYDVGFITISGATAVSGVSGSTSGTVSGSTSASGSININYTKDGSTTSGSDTFSGTITFFVNGGVPSTLRFQSGGTFTFDKFFHDPTLYALTLASTTSGTQTNLAIPTRNLGTIVQGTNPGGVFTSTITDCAVTSGSYIWYAGKYYVNGGNNSGWIFAESPTQLKTQFFL